MQFHDFNKIEGQAVNEAYLRKAIFGKALSIARVEVKQGETTRPHSHDTEEVIYVLKGRWLIHMPEGDVVLSDDQLLCIPAGVEHSSEVLEDTVAIDICSQHRTDWRYGSDKPLHHDPERYLWAV